jgi:micrococcal nuclease
LRRSSPLTFNRLFLLLLIVVLLILSIIIKKHLEKPSRPPAERTGATQVIDGDTFVDADGHKIRLLAIDTPEKGEPYYKEAKDELGRIVGDRKLRYEFGPESTDRYGRLLAFVFADDSIFVNARLLEEGLARAYFFEENMLTSPYADQLCRSQKAALYAGRNIWSLKKPRAETRYFGNPNTLRFHRPSCNSVERSDTTSMVRAANRDSFLERCYSPCRNCKP